MFFADNLRFLRKRKRFSQQHLADLIEVNRTTLSSYESGTQPPFPVLLRISDVFHLSIDALVRINLSKLSEYELSEIERGYNIDITGQKLRLLTISVDKDQKENIEMVNTKAQAGYAKGYGDPEYIEALPKFFLPFLPRNKTYRSFQIQGDSMPPVQPGAWVTASYVQDFNQVKSGEAYIVVTQDEGVVFKILYKIEDKPNALLLVSKNRNYAPYEILLQNILELWKFETYNGFEL
jgi:transcriptional regulator with XRE-family HTH domain